MTTPDDVVDLQKYRESKVVFIFAVLSMCLSCTHRWVGGIIDNKTSLFTLECPGCGERDSFVTIIPEDSMKHFGFERPQ